MGEKSPDNREQWNNSEKNKKSGADTVQKLGQQAMKGAMDKNKK